MAITNDLRMSLIPMIRLNTKSNEWSMCWKKKRFKNVAENKLGKKVEF